MFEDMKEMVELIKLYQEVGKAMLTTDVSFNTNITISHSNGIWTVTTKTEAALPPNDDNDDV